MRVHEKHCTMNPDRECRMCKMVSPGYERADFQPAPLHVLIALLPNRFSLVSKNHELQQAGVLTDTDGLLKSAIPVLRKATGNCPACMLAAIRQAGIPVPMAEDFNFTAEVKDIWNGINEDRRYHD